MSRPSLWAAALAAIGPAPGMRIAAFGMPWSPAEPALADAAAAGAAVTWFDWRHLPTAAAAGLPGRYWPWDGASALPQGACDVALVGLRALHGRASFETAMRGAAAVVRPGGVVLVGGGHPDGLRGASRRLQEWFGAAEPLVYQKGERVLRCERGLVHLPPPQPPTWAEADFAGVRLRWRRADGTFAGGAPDPGAELLADTACRLLTPALDGGCCDLACGSGFVGMAVLLRDRAARCTFVDNDLRSLAALREHLAANGLADRADIHAGDAVVQPCEQWGGPFAAVLCNPPFHAGTREDRSLHAAMAASAVSALRPGGTCLLVGVRGLRYDASVPGAVEVGGDATYRVLAVRNAVGAAGGSVRGGARRRR